MKQENSQKKIVKIFLNKWENDDNKFWNPVETELQNRGYTIYRESSECDWAILMNATFMNPSTYKNKVGFYIGTLTEITGDKVFWIDLMAPILEKYYKPGHLISIIGMTPGQTADKIENVYRQLSYAD